MSWDLTSLLGTVANTGRKLQDVGAALNETAVTAQQKVDAKRQQPVISSRRVLEIVGVIGGILFLESQVSPLETRVVTLGATVYLAYDLWNSWQENRQKLS